jgi:hypothetical protein
MAHHPRLRTFGACMALGVGLVSGLVAQEPETVEPKPTKPPAAGSEAPAPTQKKSAEQWTRELGSDDYRRRVEAESQLRAMGAQALPDLRKAAQDSRDNEVQWRARRLIRQIERGDSGALGRRRAGDDDGGVEAPQRLRVQRLPGWTQTPQLPDDIRARFEQMFGQVERDFGVDVHRSRFFADDFFRDLQEQMQSPRGGSSRGMTLQIGPDGAVRAEVKAQNDKGELETKVYEAPDMDSFRQQYPDVLGRSGLAPGLQFWFDGTAPAESMPRALPWGPQDIAPAPEVMLPPAGKRLGVTVRPSIPVELREHLDLRADLGLMVESVQDGTLAATLGLQKGDIVVRIGATDIRSTADVQEALGGIDAGAEVVVAFVRKGVEQTATARKPGAEPAAKERKLEPRDQTERRGVR